MDKPVVWLRAEGAIVFALSITLYAGQGGGWLLLLLLFFVPDVSMIGYAGGNRLGAIAYNLVHTYTAPLLLVGLGWVYGQMLPASVALIWMAHIGFDRMLGYGLKSGTGFHDTHLGRIGRTPVSPVSRVSYSG